MIHLNYDSVQAIALSIRTHFFIVFPSIIIKYLNIIRWISILLIYVITVGASLPVNSFNFDISKAVLMSGFNII